MQKKNFFSPDGDTQPGKGAQTWNKQTAVAKVDNFSKYILYDALWTC